VCNGSTIDLNHFVRSNPYRNSFLGFRVPNKPALHVQWQNKTSRLGRLLGWMFTVRSGHPLGDFGYDSSLQLCRIANGWQCALPRFEPCPERLIESDRHSTNPARSDPTTTSFRPTLEQSLRSLALFNLQRQSRARSRRAAALSMFKASQVSVREIASAPGKSQSQRANGRSPYSVTFRRPFAARYGRRSNPKYLPLACTWN